MTTDTLLAGADTSEAGDKSSADGVTPDSMGAEAQADSSKPAEGTQQSDATKAEDTTKDSKAADEVVAFEFKVPEGFELDEASANEFKAIVEDKALTKSELAQKLADLAVKREQARLEQHTRQVADWTEAVKTDKELGGDKLPETLAIAKKAIALGPPELGELLNETGMGSHPAVVKWCFAVGKALSEDRMVAASNSASGSAAVRTDEDRAARFYGSP